MGQSFETVVHTLHLFCWKAVDCKIITHNSLSLACFASDLKSNSSQHKAQYSKDEKKAGQHSFRI